MKKSPMIFILIFAAVLLSLGGGILYKLGIFETGDARQADEPTSTIVSIDQTAGSISAIKEEMQGTVRKINGTVTERSESKGHVFLVVSDESGSIEVPVFSNTKIDSSRFVKGADVEVQGTVDTYQGKLEIIPGTEEDIRLLGEHSAPSDRISKKQIGQNIEVTGNILSKYVHPKKHVFLTIKTMSGQELKIPIFASLSPNPDQYPIHSTIRIEGEVKEFNGDLEVIPATLANVHVTEKKKEEVRIKPIASIRKEDRGEQVIVEGMVEKARESNGHLFFQMRDGDAIIPSVLFKADSEEINGRKIRLENAMKSRFTVRVAATVEIYQGELELIVDKVFVD